MILVDSSVWIEYLRDSDDPVVDQLDRLLMEDADVRITEPIIMELLAGATNPLLESRISQLTNGLRVIPVDAALDYRSAAQLFVASLQNGHPLRGLSDCLIAAIAIRGDAMLFHRDRDFRYIAEVAPLRLYEG
ncbi:PIN domain nuclease [Leucobacter coleopterorum]|uniref:Ribonuclease VapC n=1 Tax=Leucobacter coleopterorum TaxID=2714933 RepID=A0ABX6JU46_9MICO|nr:PIN domain nuclease [Leucobacter coleopterorum]QIM17748.1 PIN domain nuclease [Leucobacter coleopterorum]